MNENSLDILVRLETKVDVLNQRMDRHEMKNDARFNSVFEKMDGLGEKIHGVAMDGEREAGKLKVGIATMTGELKDRKSTRLNSSH